jgi:pyridoxal phosphate enzyme (YggS family)
MSVAQKLGQVEARLAQAIVAAGRHRSEVQLLAVSKTWPTGHLLEAARAGQRCFGENRGQELRDKASPLSEAMAAEGLGPPTWHFIGHLQKNKVRYVVGTAAVLHTLDSLALARELEQRLGPEGMEALIEVNLGGEAAKSGLAPEAVLPFCAELMGLQRLRLRGLMCIPPWSEDPEQRRPWFQQLAALAAEGRRQGLPLVELSMGMSDDLEVAVSEGATIVRVGTAIFGDRG